MRFTSELSYRELPSECYKLMIEEHKKSWTNSEDETNECRGVTITCDEGFDPEDVFKYRPGTGYWY